MPSKNRTLMVLARQLKKDIGIHAKFIGTGITADKYYALQQRSDDAVADGGQYLATRTRTKPGYISDVYSIGGREYYRNKRGLCIDAPCCGCCTS